MYVKAQNIHMQIVAVQTTTKLKRRLSPFVMLGVSVTKNIRATTVAIAPREAQTKEPKISPGAKKPYPMSVPEASF